METLKKIDEKAQYVEVYNELLATIESFQRLAVNIPIEEEVISWFK